MPMLPTSGWTNNKQGSNLPKSGRNVDFVSVSGITKSLTVYFYYTNQSSLFSHIIANITPDQYTKTIGVGESVTLRVSSTDNNLRWIHNNGKIIRDWNDQTEVTIDNVRLADAGIYECFADGKREMRQHAIMRLIVRGSFFV